MMDWCNKLKGRLLHEHRIGVVILVMLVSHLISESDASCQRNMLNARGVSEKDKREILDYHNKLRQAVALGQVPGQPAAANMLEMKWDDNLARRAQSWALGCNSENHDDHRHTARFLVGQNIATMWRTAKPNSVLDMQPHFPEAIDEWFNEYRRYHYGPFTAYGSANIGHYTQMAWASSNLIGCGFTYYFDSKGYTRNYICNYGPSGNVLTRMPYVKGQQSCERYNYAQSRSYKGLCDIPSKYYEYDIRTNYIGK